jgi:hypothetical protein
VAVRRKPIDGWRPALQRRNLAAQRLRAAGGQAPRGRLDHGVVRDMSAAVGVSRSQMRRDARVGEVQPRKRRRFEINEHDRAALIASHGHLKVAYRAIAAAGWKGHDRAISYVQFTRAVRRDVSEADWLRWSYGEAAARQAELKLRHCQPQLPGLYFDAKQYSVWVRHPSEPSKLIQPYAVKGKWTHCAYVTRPVCSPDPPTHHVVARAVQNALLPDPTWGPAHGMPAFIGHDNGGELIGDQLTMVLVDLVLPNRLSKPYRPSQNGTIESFHPWEEQHICVPDEFYAHGPARYDVSRSCRRWIACRTTKTGGPGSRTTAGSCGSTTTPTPSTRRSTARRRSKPGS